MVNEGGREGNIIVGNQEGGRSGSGIVVLGRVGDTVTLAVVNEGGGRRVVGVKVVVWGEEEGEL